MRIQRASLRPSTRRGSSAVLVLQPRWMPSWIALPGGRCCPSRSRRSPCSRRRRAGRARRCRSPSCPARARRSPRPAPRASCSSLRAHSALSPAPRTATALDSSRHRVGHQVADRPAVGHRARMSEEEMSSRGIAKKSMRSCRPAAPSARSISRRGARALGHREPGEPEHLLGLPPGRQARGHVAADDEGQLVPVAAHAVPQGIDRVATGPPARSRVARPRAARRRRPPPAQRQPHLGARVVGDLLVRRRGPASARRGRGRAGQRLLRADQMSDVRRVERPAEDADARPAL